MNNQKQTTSLVVNLNVSEKFAERLIIILLSSFFSFNSGVIYAKHNKNQNHIDKVNNSKTMPQNHIDKVNNSKTMPQNILNKTK